MRAENIKVSIKDVPEVIKQIETINKELDQYKNNWEELKKWVNEDKELAGNNFEMGRCFNMFDILNKMKELEEDK